MRTPVTELFGIEVPIIQAPMAGSSGSALAIAVANAGGLGSLPCAMLTPSTVRDEVATFRSLASGPVHLNFFCHARPEPSDEQLERWKQMLAGYYAELDIEPPADVRGIARAPFDEDACELVEELRPEIVSFHFGLPATALVERVFATGAKVISSATTVHEAVWLEDHGCDAVIAQGVEAGGHRGMFLTDDIATQMGTMALVPLIVDAVEVPVIAAGGISDARGIGAAFLLGAAAVQLGTAYLLCPESIISSLHRRALAERNMSTALTNVFTGRPARGLVNRVVAELGPMSPAAPPFPLAANVVGPLRSAAEARGSSDFSPLWSGQAGPLAREMPAGELTRSLIAEAEALLA